MNLLMNTFINSESSKLYFKVFLNTEMLALCSPKKTKSKRVGNVVIAIFPAWIEASIHQILGKAKRTTVKP